MRPSTDQGLDLGRIGGLAGLGAGYAQALLGGPEGHLVLDQAGGLVRVPRKAQLLRHIGGGDRRGIARIGRDALDALALGQGQHRLLVGGAHVVVGVREGVPRIARQVIAGDHLIAQLLRFPDGGDLDIGPAQHQELATAHRAWARTRAAM